MRFYFMKRIKLKSPIYFQPLEQELEPILEYLTGNVLNAGCGDRDISSFLLSHGAISVENCDIKSSIPNAINCNLTQIPRDAETYDSILCNAVLEHVQFPHEVSEELHRLLKANGILVLCVPFLQPYHPYPTDFQRYTRDGLQELARLHNFEVVKILPVHSLAQTVTWIVWSYWEEKRQRLLQLLFWVPLFLWCRLSQKSDTAVINNANAYQIVLEKISINCKSICI